MALINCAECNKEISDKATACPHCGVPRQPMEQTTTRLTDTETQKKSSVWKWVIGAPIGAFVLLMVVGSCAGNTPEGQARSSDRAAIDLCWKEQSRKSLDPGTARFAASACERMESDFRQKHGRNP